MTIIDVYQKNLIECDHCNYVIPNPTGDPHEDAKEYINQPCPQCGHNLLTEKDYNDDRHIINLIDKINKWFGWLGYFFKNKKTVGYVHTYKGIKITDKNS